jgi:hypothetical protein
VQSQDAVEIEVDAFDFDGVPDGAGVLDDEVSIEHPRSAET